MKKIIYVIFTSLIVCCFFSNVIAAVFDENSINIDLDNIDQKSIDNLVEDILKKSNVPGASIVLVSGDQTKYLSYGYANKEQKTEITNNTLFELGSMSKAFTGLGILLLEDQGKLSLDDPVTKHIPWLEFKYSGMHDGKTVNDNVELTIANFLYQTSGVPFKTIGYIPEGISDSILENTVRTLIGTNLDFYPGDKFQYATLNYDVLGYIIQIVSGQTYEEFIYENILTPLCLNNTYLFADKAKETGLLAQGYKMSFFDAKPYDAPRYRGNTPAGYVISNTEDMGRWIRIQMGLVEISEQFNRIVAKSHVGDMTVASQGNFYYAVGWRTNIKSKIIEHGGGNPNYSSMIYMKSEVNTGICVLSNMDSNAAGYIAENILNILDEKEISKYSTDSYKTMDTTFTLVFAGSIILGTTTFVLFIIAIIEMISRKRNREKLRGIKIVGILFAIPVILFYGFCIYYLPNILFSRLPWQAVNVWGPKSIMSAGIAAFFAGVLFFIYAIYIFNFPKPKERNYFALIILSLINGFSGALTIFVINETFNRNLEYSMELLIYFVFSIAFITYSNRLFQSKMIVITNEITYEKRIKMIDKIINSSFQAIEKIGGPRLYTGLHNDVAVYAQFPGMVINFVQSILTLLFCLGYLCTISIAAFITTICVLSLNCYVGYLVGQISRKYQEKNRDVLDIYYGQMNDLIYGFKELVISKLRKNAFLNDMKKYSRLSTELNKESAIKFLNYGMYNHIMYNAIFGVVVFVLPLIMIGINVNDLRQTLFMVFYLLGPFGAVVRIIPTLTGVRVSLRRIKNLIDDLDEISTGYNGLESSITFSSKNMKLELNDVIFSYIMKIKDTNENNIEFTLGPINTEINTGEITYITGGNGSGKSTLGKIITGLYAPEAGKILLNNTECNMIDLNQCFTAVYSDFYLFKKFYGVDIISRKGDITDLIKLMKLDKKIEFDENGEFKSLNLSTGQKKRLAYIVCCLDDKPFVLFDEWAAEQDPEFRAYFYDELLPGLKKQGKGIIVITHDDRFFNLADKMIKLERGTLVDQIKR